MRKTIIYSITAMVCGVLTPQANARNFAVKAYGDIGLVKPMSVTSALPGLSDKSSSNAFGLDFGYTFWRLGNNSLEANIGIGYRMVSAKFELPSLNYHYSAPALADMDGDTYIRYYELTDLSQKVDWGYLSIPLYLRYQYRATKWLGINANLGFDFGFKCNGSLKSVNGTAYTYGIYPQYDDLMINEPYLNGFGENSLENAMKGKPGIKGFNCSVMTGAGLEFYTGSMVSFDLGIRYNAGLTKVFSEKYSDSNFNAESVPVSYTVAEGEQVKPFSDYILKSKLRPLSLHVGINLRF